MTTPPKKKKPAFREEVETDHHVSCSFSLPRSIKGEMDERAARLRLTRTDYLKLLVLADLDKGDAPLEIIRTPREPAPEPDKPKKK
jgi:hypothetical protein